MITTAQTADLSFSLPIAAAADADNYELFPLRRPEVLAIGADAARGDKRARLIMMLFNTMVREVQSRPPYDLAACVSCGRRVTGNRFVGAVALPLNVEPDSRLKALMICEPCGANKRDLRDRAAKAFRAIWPSARLIEPTHAASRA